MKADRLKIDLLKSLNIISTRGRNLPICREISCRHAPQNYRFATSLIIFFLLFILSLSIFTSKTEARDWTDLDEGEHDIFGSEKEEKYPINAFIIEKEDWADHYSFMAFWLYKNTNYPRYTSFRFLPFYYNLKSKIDNREKTIVPLFWYNRVEGNSELLVTPLYYSNINAVDSDRSFLYLFWWGKDGTGYASSYKFFIPFLFYKSDSQNKDNSKTESLWINPLFISKNNTTEKNGLLYFSNTNLSILHFYESDVRPNETTTTWWAPILPLTYHHRSPAGGHRNIFWLLDYAWKTDVSGDTLKRFWVAPFWFWKRGNNGYNHILPPIFINSTSTNGESYTHLLPFYIYKKDIEYNYDYRSANNFETYNETSISLLHYHSKKFVGEKKWDGELKNYTEWYPIIPLYYKQTDSARNTHRNLLWIFDWHINSDRKLDRFWAIPFWFEGSDYRHILFPMYMSFKRDNGEYYKHFLPLLFFSWNKNESANTYSGKDTSGGIYKETMLSLLFCYSGRYAGTEQKKDLLSKTLWFPIIPLFYRSADKEDGSHTNLLWLIDWAGDKDESLQRLWLIPFVFHQAEESGYRYYFPFYMRPSGNTEKNGSSFGIFHYHEWSQQQRIMWVGPCYVKYIPEKKEHFGLLLPIYATWRSGKSEGEILLPWSINYKDNKRSLYVNILGISRSVILGPLNPEVLLDAGTYNGRWYLDTDFSWLYNVFSFSTRISIKNPWSSEGAIQTKGLEENANLTEIFADDFKKNGQNKPSIQKKSELSRDTSEFFWGYKLLFGWFAYERGDTKRHIRLLPLWWFTWDKDSDDKLYTVPFAFLSYKSQELEYFILFPLFIPIYGYQKEKDSYAKGFLINLYWDEYNADEKLREQTILWPLINWYSSPNKNGWRFFPLIWHKESINDDLQISKNIILPLLFYSNYEKDKNDNLVSKSVISPLFYSRKTTNTSQINETTMFPIIPLLYYSSYDKVIYSSATATDTGTGEDKKNIPAGRIKSIERSQTHILPLFYFYWDKITAWNNGIEEKESNFLLLGYYSRITKREEKSILLFGLYSQKNNLTNSSSETGLLYGLFSYASGKESECYLIPFWYYFSSPLEKHLNVLLFFDNKSSNNYERFFILPFWYSGSENGSSHKNILGLIDWKRDSKGELTRSWFLPFYSWYPGEKSGLFIFPLLAYFGSSPKESTSFIAGLYLHSSEFYERQNFLYLFDHEKYIKDEHEEYNFLLSTIHYETSRYKTEWELAFGFLMDYEGYNNSKNYKFDFLLFMSNWERNGDYWQSSIMPFWYYSEDAGSWSFLTPVGLSYFSKDRQGDLDLGLLGLLYFRNNDIPENSDTRAVLAGSVYWERKKPERGYHSFGSLWGILWDYETESETGFSKFTLLRGLIKRVESKGETKYNFFWVL